MDLWCFLTVDSESSVTRDNCAFAYRCRTLLLPALAGAVLQEAVTAGEPVWSRILDGRARPPPAESDAAGDLVQGFVVLRWR